jgi:hypothetical protein
MPAVTEMQATWFRQLRAKGSGQAAGRDVRALHEAGHVLVGILLGWRVGWVRIYGPRASARTGFDGGVKMAPPPRAALSHRSAVRLAGETAERLCTDRDIRQIRHDSEDDWEKLWGADLSRSHLGIERQTQLVRQGRRLARSLIEEHREAFLGLAGAIASRAVTGEQAHRIVDRRRRGPAD